jgi:hypothetical protein
MPKTSEISPRVGSCAEVQQKKPMLPGPKERCTLSQLLKVGDLEYISNRLERKDMGVPKIQTAKLAGRQAMPYGKSKVGQTMSILTDFSHYK